MALPGFPLSIKTDLCPENASLKCILLSHDGGVLKKDEVSISTPFSYKVYL